MTRQFFFAGGRRIWAGASSGFSLLEAIIAMTIVGGALTSILLLQARLSANLAAIERTVERAAWRDNVSELAARLNDSALTSPLTLQGYQVSWRQTEPFLTEHRNRIRIREAGPAIVAIGRMEFTIRKGAETLLTTQQLILQSRPATPAPP